VPRYCGNFVIENVYVNFNRDQQRVTWPAINNPGSTTNILCQSPKMAAPTDTTTELMTEHLQYAPLTFIDDVINSANAILYQAMDAFECYLRETVIPGIPTTASSSSTAKTFDLDASNEDPERDALHTELEFGMAQVETLLENAVDRNFDAFELYLLRNVFNVPDDVDGYLRLQHHLVRPGCGCMGVDSRDLTFRRRRNKIRRLKPRFNLLANGYRRF